MITNHEFRAVREQLRHEVFASLNEIENIVAAALDFIAEEAVTFGADQQHDFAVDAVAAKTVDRINYELEQITAKVLQILPVVEIEQECSVASS